MRIRSGLYVVYKSKEYHSYDKGEYFNLLTSEEEKGFKLCFKSKTGKTYEKFILKSEASDCYKIDTYAIHKGIDSGILGGKDKEHRDIFVNVYTNEDVKRAVEAGFKMWEMGLYRKVDVPIKELKFYEIKSEYDLWDN
ncbi:MAG: hypothetical protein LBL93_07665 [Ruminococcus sp.]|jgi:hypothetical protein|nr:hypothetical protein [Ruminococcus sp.]